MRKEKVMQRTLVFTFYITIFMLVFVSISNMLS